MDTLNDDVIRLIITFLVPKKVCLLNASPRFTACFCIDKYTSKIDMKKDIKKEWKKCTKDPGLGKMFCKEHTKDYSDLIAISKKIKNLNKYAGHYIHFDTKKRANMAKPYIRKKNYTILQSCCYGKGHLLSKN